MMASPGPRTKRISTGSSPGNLKLNACDSANPRRRRRACEKMPMAYNTGNAIGSTSPKDLSDNARNMDLLVLGPLLSYPDRRGVNRLSWAGIEAAFAATQAQRTLDFQAQMASMGYELPPLPYASGLNIVRVTQLIEKDDEFYRAKAGTVPFVTTGDWSVDQLKLVSVGDAALRFELARPAGSELVGKGSSTVYEILDSIPLSASKIFQRKVFEPFAGFDNGTTDTQIYPLSRNTFQGIAYCVVGGVEKLFATQRPTGPTWADTERCRIVEYDLVETGAPASPVSFSGLLNIGHGFDISAEVVDGVVTLFTSSVTAAGKGGVEAGKGYSKISWRGSATSQADVASYQLWGEAGSGHPFQRYNRAGVALSTDGRWLVMSSAPISGAQRRPVFVYDRAEVEALFDKLQARPRYRWIMPQSLGESAYSLQGIAADSSKIHTLESGTDTFGQHVISTFDFSGNLLRRMQVDDARAQYKAEGLLDHPTLGNPVRFEAEGLTIRGEEILISCQESWKAGAKIITWHSKNWAAASLDGSPTTGIPPSNGRVFVRTTKAATNGAWVEGSDYGKGTNFTLEKKTIYAFGPEVPGSEQEPIDTGITDALTEAAVDLGEAILSATFRWRNACMFGWRSERTEESGEAFGYDTSSRWKVLDQRESSDRTTFTSLQANYTTTMRAAILRGAGTTAAESAVYRLHAANCPAYPGAILEFTGPLGAERRRVTANGETIISSSIGYCPITSDRPDSGKSLILKRAGVEIGGLSQNSANLIIQSAAGLNVRFGTSDGAGAPVAQWELAVSTGAWRPFVDNAYSLGQPSLRPSVLYAGTGTINTSDATHKTDPREMDESEIRVGRRLTREIGVWQWRASIQEKGEDARLHVGPTVQAAIAIFEDEGLDPLRYGMICYDKWGDQYEPVMKKVMQPRYVEVEIDGETVMEAREVEVEIDTGETRLVREAGELFGFREGQTHALMLYALAADMDAFEARLEVLESK